MKKMQSYRIDTETIRQIDDLAELLNNTKSGIIEITVAEHYKKHEEKIKKSLDDQDKKFNKTLLQKLNEQNLDMNNPEHEKKIIDIMRQIYKNKPQQQTA